MHLLILQCSPTFKKSKTNKKKIEIETEFNKK